MKSESEVEGIVINKGAKEDCTFKIRSVQANRVYQANNDYVDKDENGIIKKYYLTWRDAVINDSIFSHYMFHHGVRLMKKDHTLDFVIIKFDYSVLESADNINDNKPAISPDKLREMYYRDGCEITWNTYDKKTGEIVVSQTILYRMLYRTPGKAKDGSCIFIRDELLNKARKYLTMDLYDKMPDTGAKIVEMSAYSTLITASAMDYIHIPMENILIVKDQKSATELPALAVRVDDEKHCCVKEYEKYKIENVLWDGMGLIDDSIFPEDMEEFIYCRSHFFKSCLFRGNIQQYFKDYYKTEYETATVTDMFGNVMKVSDVKVIVTDNSIKWLKFKELMGKTDLKAYRSYKKFMQKDGEQFAIVKTAHKSKYGNLQRSSYQMNNSLPTTDQEVLQRIAQPSIDYYNTMIKSTDAFVDYLRMNKSVYSIDRILVALYEHNTDIQYTSFFKDRKSDILSKFKRKRLMLGKLLQEGDNLTICGNPISLLMMVTGQDYLNEGCFTSRGDGIECYTKRFADGECLAGFRSPHNSPNNIVHLINGYSKPIQRYFPKLGDNIIIINGIGSDVQARLNGQDLDSDSCYVTDQTDIVDLAKKAYMEYPTIVNEIPLTGTSVYSKDMESYAKMDSKIASGQDDVGSSSNIAQLALSYYSDAIYHTGEQNKDLRDIFVICSILAQVSIDASKRGFDVSVGDELIRLQRKSSEINKKNNKSFGRSIKIKYPVFYSEIQEEKQKKKQPNKKSKNKMTDYFKCPMEILSQFIYDATIDTREKQQYRRKTIAIKDVFIFPDEKVKKTSQYKSVITKARAFDIEMKKLDTNASNYSDMAICTFENYTKSIKRLKISKPTMQVLIITAFRSESYMQNRLLEMLFDYDKELFLSCFYKKQHQKMSEM